MSVHILLEHPVPDYEAWKGAFDADPVHREASGVRSYRILRPVDDPNYVAVELEFADRERAGAFREALLALWRSSAAQAVMRDPQIRIVEAVEARTYPG
ncbi:MAG: hypothetical protein AB1627_14060 [Chloroflexota bacterium]